MKIFAISIAVALTGCASNYKPTPQQIEEKDNAFVSLGSCYMRAAKALDDGVSGANIVATAVRAACDKESQTTRLAVAKTISDDPGFIRDFPKSPELDRKDQETATSIVLQLRSKRK